MNMSRPPANQIECLIMLLMLLTLPLAMVSHS